jgi:hypothetical protein
VDNESFRILVFDVLATCFMLVSYVAYSSTLKLEAVCYARRLIEFQQAT